MGQAAPYSSGFSSSSLLPLTQMVMCRKVASRWQAPWMGQIFEKTIVVTLADDAMKHQASTYCGGQSLESPKSQCSQWQRESKAPLDACRHPILVDVCAIWSDVVHKIYVTQIHTHVNTYYTCGWVCKERHTR